MNADDDLVCSSDSEAEELAQQLQDDLNVSSASEESSSEEEKAPIKPKKKVFKKAVKKVVKKVEPESTETCNCCTEAYTSTMRKKTTCPYCQAHACVGCHKAYLMSTVHNAHCMFCKVAFNQDFLRDSFTNNWLTKEYSQVEMNLMWELEKSLLPDTAKVIEREKFERSFNQHNDSLLRQVAGLQDRLQQISYELHPAHVYGNQRRINVRNVYNLVNSWNQVAKDLTFNMADMNQEYFEQLFSQATATEGSQSRTRHITFTKPCPAPECRGFLSTAWKCGFCDTKVCPDCHAIKRLGKKTDEKEPEHVCKQEDLATAAMLAKDTKNCPKCGVMIYRIEGCSQMFCTSCHTAFDWRTLAIINKGIHNPHYFEWLNKNKKAEAGEAAPLNQLNLCGGNDARLPDYSQVSGLARNKFGSSTLGIIANFMMSVNHIHAYRPRVNATNNEDLRKKYLENTEPIDRVKMLMYKRFKQQRFVQAINEVEDMLYQAAHSIITAILTNNDLRSATASGWVPKKQPLKVQQLENDTIKQIHQLCLYYNQCIYQVHQRYKSAANFEVFDKQFNRMYTDRKRFYSNNNLLCEYKE